MKMCPGCAVAVHDDAIQCDDCGRDLRGTEQFEDTTPESPDVVAPESTEKNSNSERVTSKTAGSKAMRGRYTDAYYIAEATVGWGGTIKTIGIIIAVLIMVAGFVASERAGFGAIIMSLVISVCVGVTYYIFGVIISALGQVLRAILDTAVNTSPLLSVEQKRRAILGAQSTAESYTGP